VTAGARRAPVGSHAVFTPEHRAGVRRRLLDRARDDARIVGAALTGSAAHDAEDRWSDIDLFFGIADDAALETVLGDWTDFMCGELGARHHFDVRSAAAVYRVFLLPDCLEVDVAFTPARTFGALGPAFDVVFGDAVEPRVIAPPDPDRIIGLAWHHVLHARICIERGRPWQAEYWISAVRDHALALACLRLGRPADHAKGADAVTSEISAPLEAALVRDLSVEELSRALRAVVGGLLGELDETDRELADRLREPLRELAARR